MKINKEFWRNEIAHTLIVISLVILLGTIFSPAKVRGQESKLEQKRMQSLTNSQVIEALSSHNNKEAHKAVVEIMTRGEMMLPLLASCKGDSRYFYGYGLGDSEAAFIFPIPSSDEEENDGEYITIEVAALYLISLLSGIGIAD